MTPGGCILQKPELAIPGILPDLRLFQEALFTLILFFLTHPNPEIRYWFVISMDIDRFEFSEIFEKKLDIWLDKREK